MIYIVDADDFYDVNSNLWLLQKIKFEIPKFKITLFTVPGKCSVDFMSRIAYDCGDWIEMVPHGWLHATSRECEDWSYYRTVRYIQHLKDYYHHLVSGFKAPGWQISDATYKALYDYNYWVADQSYNDNRRPKELRAYVLQHDEPEITKLHYHIQNVCGNGIAEKFDELISLDKSADFKFISEHINETD